MPEFHSFIAGDWGTSNLRLYLCQTDGDKATVIETRSGAGISQLNGEYDDHFFSLTEDWLDQHQPTQIILSGMVGSNIGWKAAPYLNCPATAKDVASGRLQFTSRGFDISILAGLKTVNPLSSVDVMRGEELQLLGWSDLNPNNKERQLFALPGTHNKWAAYQDSKIQTFLTAFTGELFALLRDRSTLIADGGSDHFNQDVFLEGVKSAARFDKAQFLHTVFATRAKQVTGEMNPEDSLSYLSGLIIGSDIVGAMALFPNTEGITIIGEPSLSSHYQLALNSLDISSQLCDPNQIAIAGYHAIFQELENQ